MKLEELLESEDMELIEGMAKKYKMSLMDLGKIISNSDYNKKNKPIYMRVTKEENEILIARCKESNLPKSKLCYLYFSKALELNKFESIDLVAINKRKDNKDGDTIRVIFPMNPKGKSDFLLLEQLYAQAGISLEDIMN